MEEILQDIIEKSEFKEKDKFFILLTKCIQVSNDSGRSTYAILDNLIFRADLFFKGFPEFVNNFGKDKKYASAVHALKIITDELGFEMEPAEAFILYHIRELGKFRMREDKLLAELKPLWLQVPYKEYALESGDFSYALKNLMRMKFIEYRRGNLWLKQSVLVRFKTGSRVARSY